VSELLSTITLEESLSLEVSLSSLSILFPFNILSDLDDDVSTLSLSTASAPSSDEESSSEEASAALSCLTIQIFIYDIPMFWVLHGTIW